MATDDLTISDTNYRWSVRTLRLLQAVLKVNLKIHPNPQALARGEILVVNRFAHSETFIPQYLLYESTGEYCRTLTRDESVATDPSFASYLQSIGVVPRDHPDLMVFLVMEVLRGRRLLLFADDHPVQHHDDSPPRHDEAATIALAVAACRHSLRTLAATNDQVTLNHWSERLKIDQHTLLSQAACHTYVLPVSFSFYPLQVPPQTLARGAELFRRPLARRLRQTLLIESNKLLQNTDLDVRVGTALDAEAHLNWWETRLFDHLAKGLTSPGAALPTRRGLYPWLMRRVAPRLRERYRANLEPLITVNLCHLAALALRSLWRQGLRKILLEDFQRLLYLMLKALQQSRLYLHRGLRNPAYYRGLLGGECPGLEQFLSYLQQRNTLLWRGQSLQLLPEIDRQYPLRQEDPLSVYANEVAHLAPVQQALQEALKRYRDIPLEPLIQHQLDDEQRRLAWLRQEFSRHRYRQLPINHSRMADPTPFLLRPSSPLPLGILLIHDVLESPAEFREFGRELCEQGFPVYGLRLAGHGTSPWDLHDTTWEDWLASVRRGYRLLASLSGRVALVGSGGGGSLALLLAAEQPPGLVGIATVNTPLGYRAPALRHLPLVSSTQRLIYPKGRAGDAFLAHEPANPNLSYSHIPLRSLQQLQRLRSALLAALVDVQRPVLLLQGDRDPLVDPASASQLLEKLGTERKRLISIPSHRHGIIHEAVGETRPVLSRYLSALASTVPPPVVPGRSRLTPTT